MQDEQTPDEQAPEEQTPEEPQQGDPGQPDQEPSAEQPSAPEEEPQAAAEESPAEEPPAEAEEPPAEAEERRPRRRRRRPPSRLPPRRAVRRARALRRRGCEEEEGGRSPARSSIRSRSSPSVSWTPRSGRAARPRRRRARREREQLGDVDETAPVAAKPAKLSGDARFAATGKRKSSVARVILMPGNGTIQVNNRSIDEYFPRAFLQSVAKQPLTQTGYEGNLDARIRVHGGGVSGQAAAVRTRDRPRALRRGPGPPAELKRRGMLTRDAREGAAQGGAQEGPQEAAVLQALASARVAERKLFGTDGVRGPAISSLGPRRSPRARRSFRPRPSALRS